MAKKTATRSIVQYRRAPTPRPIIIRPRVAPAKKKHGGHRRHHAKGNLQKTMLGAAIGGFLIGFIEKQFPTLPTLPVVGKKGAIAGIAYVVAGKGSGQLSSIARDVAVTAAGLAGYEYGTTGKVSGEVTSQTGARRVSGLASQT